MTKEQTNDSNRYLSIIMGVVVVALAFGVTYNASLSQERTAQEKIEFCESHGSEQTGHFSCIRITGDFLEEVEFTYFDENYYFVVEQSEAIE